VRAIRKTSPPEIRSIIGFATQDIAPGDWVHEHNIGFHAVDRDYQFESMRASCAADRATFQATAAPWQVRHPQLSGHPHQRELFPPWRG